MMEGKCSIAIFLVLCFAWEVNSAVTCTASGRYADPADTTCKNYTLCVALSNGSYLSYNYVCPFASLFDPTTAQCSNSYVCNVTMSACLTEGFFTDPNSSNCSTYISCVNVSGTFLQTTLTCPSNTYYDPVTTLCETDYTCTFTCTAAGRYANPADRSCQSYFLCVKETNGTFSQYQYNCTTVSVFNPSTKICTTSYTCPTA